MRGYCSFCWYWWNCWPSLLNFLSWQKSVCYKLLYQVSLIFLFIRLLLVVEGTNFYSCLYKQCMSVRLSDYASPICFLLNNVSSFEANNLKCIHKFRDPKWKVPVIINFTLYNFFWSGVMLQLTLARSRGIHFIWTHSSIFYLTA